MKSLVIITIILGAVLPLQKTFAEEVVPAQSAPTRQNIIRERLTKQKENYLQSLQEARAVSEQFRNAENQEERRALRQKARQGFIIRLGGAVEQLSKMQDRVENRIETSESEGLNVEEARTLLETSKTELGIVLDIQEEIKILLETTEDATISAETKEAIKTKFDLMKTHFKNARISLIDSLQALRTDGEDEEEVEETETVEETNS